MTPVFKGHWREETCHYLSLFRGQKLNIAKKENNVDHFKGKLCKFVTMATHVDVLANLMAQWWPNSIPVYIHGAVSEKWVLNIYWDGQYDQGPFYLYRLTLIPSWIRNHIPVKCEKELPILHWMEKLFSLTSYDRCDHLSMLGLKLKGVIKAVPSKFHKYIMLGHCYKNTNNFWGYRNIMRHL